jgi:UDP-glucose:(heptosyl)LPS alpha-1,3-glucosyltransferase
MRALIDRGADVTIIARSWPKDAAALNFLSCDPPRWSRALRAPLFAQAACRLVSEREGALVQAHERIPGCDIFYTSEGVHAAYLERRVRDEGLWRSLSFKMTPFHQTLLRLERQMFQNNGLKAVVAISRMVEEDVHRHYDIPHNRICYIPHGIDLDRFSLDVPARMRVQMREKMSIPNDRRVMLFVGSDFRRKGLGVSIEAMANSKDDSELWVVGHDKDADLFAEMALRNGLGRRFRMIGPQPDPVPYYAAADAVILASQYDPFGSVVVEGLACGLPVVASLDTGAKEAAERIDPLLICNARDVQSVARSIMRAFELAGRSSTKLTARAIAENYGIDQMVDRMMSLYADLAPEVGVSI